RSAILRAKLSTLEERAGQGGASIPHVGRTGGESGKLRADLADECGQSNLGEEIRQARADVGVGRNQELLTRQHVGSATQQLTGQPGGNIRSYQPLVRDGVSLHLGCGTAQQENAL